MFMPPSQTILIYEHVTGGGLAGEPIPESWAVEGAAMRRALAAEFAAGRPAPRVIVALDPRLPAESGPWKTVRVDSIEQLEALAREADCTLLIAPETSGVLEGLTRRLERASTCLLGSSANAVALAGNKAAMAERLRLHKLPTPATLVLNPGDQPPVDWTYPAVVKPVDGAGSIDTFRIEGPADFDRLPDGDVPRLLQEFVPGIPMSATFLVRPWTAPRLLAIGEQRMDLVDGRFAYNGGVIPARHHLDEEPLVRAVRSLPGLEGLVGVDFVYDPERRTTTILEINPRPTTSIVGLLALLRPGRLAGAWLTDGAAEDSHWALAMDTIALELMKARPLVFSASGTSFRPFGDPSPPLPADDAPGRATAWLAFDIGGANLKAAHSSGVAKSSAFAVWVAPDDLQAALEDLAADLPGFDRLFVTMTAELCDCFETKREGVRHILKAVAAAFPDHDARYWGTDGDFHDRQSIEEDPLVAAASNWLALATVAAGLVGNGPAVLIDVGTTTTDVIPILGGRVAARGRTDTERLRNGELIYAGVSRTPVCALATELPFQGASTGLAAELFATTGDVYVILGNLAPEVIQTPTADGRPASRERSVERLARIVCADRESCSDADAVDLARAADGVLFDRLLASARRACEATIGRPEVAVVSGSGEFLARRVAEALVGSAGTVRSLGELWGPAASDAACARALIELAAIREADRA